MTAHIWWALPHRKSLDGHFPPVCSDSPWPVWGKNGWIKRRIKATLHSDFHNLVLLAEAHVTPSWRLFDMLPYVSGFFAISSTFTTVYSEAFNVWLCRCTQGNHVYLGRLGICKHRARRDFDILRCKKIWSMYCRASVYPEFSKWFAQSTRHI